MSMNSRRADQVSLLTYIAVRSTFVLAYYMFPVSLVLASLAMGFDTGQIAALTVARTLPLIVALPLGGVLIDKYSPRALLVICQPWQRCRCSPWQPIFISGGAALR